MDCPRVIKNNLIEQCTKNLPTLGCRKLGNTVMRLLHCASTSKVKPNLTWLPRWMDDHMVDGRLAGDLYVIMVDKDYILC